MSTGYTKEELKVLKTNLRKVKQEWIESKSGPRNSTVEYIGSSTVMQILNEYVEGEWSFTIHEQWREELYRKQDKQNPGNLTFVGYAFHVRGTLYIEGLGSRQQYGVKVGVGDPQADSNGYKAAASSCLSKCANMFNIGADLYSKIKVESDMNEQEYQQETQQQWQQQQWQQPQQPMYDPNQQPQQPMYDPNQQPQQPMYDPNQQWQQPQQTQYQQYPQQPQMGDVNNNWGSPLPGQPAVNTPYQQAQPMNGYEPMYGNQGQGYQMPAPVPQPAFNMTPDATSMPMPQPEYMAQPNEQLPVGDTGPDGPLTMDDMMQPTPDVWQSTNPLQQAQTNPNAVMDEAPFENVPPKQVEEQKPADAKYFNPQNVEWMKAFNDERIRLQLGSDASLNATLRDYFENQNATIAMVTQDNLEALVMHMRTLQAPGAA